MIMRVIKRRMYKDRRLQHEVKSFVLITLFVVCCCLQTVLDISAEWKVTRSSALIFFDGFLKIAYLNFTSVELIQSSDKG